MAVTKEYDEKFQARSAELIAELQQHIADIKAEPGWADADEQKIMESWFIQKIAGLQLVVQGLADRMMGSPVLVAKRNR